MNDVGHQATRAGLSTFHRAQPCLLLYPLLLLLLLCMLLPPLLLLL
jgi:hypothetical protein